MIDLTGDLTGGERVSTAAQQLTRMASIRRSYDRSIDRKSPEDDNYGDCTR